MNQDSDNQNGNKRRVHPKKNANILSRFSFLYNLGIIWDIYKKGTFQNDQLFEVIDNCKSKDVGDEIDIFLKKNFKYSGAVSLIKILWKCYGVTYLIVGLIQFIIRSAVIIVIPMILSKIILYFQPAQEELTKTDVVKFAALFVFLNFLSVTYLHNYLFYLAELGIKIRASLSSAIFRKSLRLTTKSLSRISVGKIVTLVTKDVAMVETCILYFNDTWIGVIQTVIVFYLIYNKMGLATCVGMGFFVLIVPLQVIIGKITTRLRLSSSKGADERLQVTKETLSGIRVIKMNTWEDVFEDKINKNRKKEMSAILKLFISKISVLLMGSLTSKIAYYLLLTTYILLGNTISAELIYYVTALFLRIRHALSVAIPVGVTAIADTSASITRIKEFLSTEEITQKQEVDNIQEKPRVSFTGVTINLNNKEILRNVNLQLDSGLVVVTGPTGSGKTIFLKCILEENDCITGNLYKYGCISYAPQEPWIYPSSLKQNIIFNQPFDKERYHKVLEVCALKHDIYRLPSGDDSIISDSGTNLSKGQQCRINLARAVYRKADIYLIDDCLTSLDINIQKHVVQRCIKEFLADKICIFVTQNLRFIEKNDKIVVVDEGKAIVSQKVFLEHQENLQTIPEQETSFENSLETDSSTINNEIDTVTEDSALLVSSKKENMYQENVKLGKVDFKSYKNYGKYGGGLLMVIIIFIFFVLSQISKSYSEKILSNWVNTIHQNSSESTTEKNTYLTLYSIFTLAITVLSIFSAFLLFNFSRTASMKLHKNTIESVINATMVFFDTHLIGNIINRFSKDLTLIDEQIPFTVYEFLQNVLDLCGMVILIAAVNITLILPSVSLFIILFFLRKLYIPTGRSLQRLDMTARGPVMGYLNSSLEGLTTIRAFQAETVLIEEFDRHLDLYTSASYTSKCCDRGFAYYLDVCCTIYMGVIMAILIIFDKETSVGDVGLAITQAVTLNGIGRGIRQWTEIEKKMTSVERILEYSEAEREVQNPKSKCVDWPKLNRIQFEKVTFSYKNSSNCILENINFEVSGGEKLGIVGRTGSGKSTLMSLLFRFYEYQGSIKIGGEDIRNIPLKTLRSNMSIISQNPILFSSTLRQNLDPKNTHSDVEIWNAIKTVQMDNIVKSLDIEMNESGSTFSTGQKQLLCLARCLLSKNKIVILDEATSDVDQENEKLINSVFRDYFKDCTLLIVAHKLSTMLNCDRILVMQDGKVAENGNVSDLEKDENSLFYSMLQKSRLQGHI